MRVRGIIQFVEQTFQGEAFEPGHPATLLRFKECVVGCPWCDTMKEARKLVEFEVEIDRIFQAAQRTGYLMITGGEPFLYPEELMKLFLFSPHTPGMGMPMVDMSVPMPQPPQPPQSSFNPVKMVLETTLYNPALTAEQIESFIQRLMRTHQGYVFFTVSPKVKTIEKLQSLYERIAGLPNVRFKFVLAGNEDEKVETLSFLTKLVERFPLTARPQKFALMPQGATPDELNKNVQDVLQICRELNVSFSPRLQIAHNFA